MPAHMADLPEFQGSILLSDSQRQRAAVSLADRFGDKHVLAYFLVQLGLARHCSDGTFTAIEQRDGSTWFSPRNDRTKPTFTLPVGKLDDCR